MDDPLRRLLVAAPRCTRAAAPPGRRPQIPRWRQKMSELMQIDSYGTLVGPDTIRIQRLLPGPIERVWAYLVDNDLRRLWFASSDAELVQGAQIELVWRNDDLSRKGDRPSDMPEEHRMASEVVLADPPNKLVIAWANTGNVTFELEQHGERVLLTLT